MESTLDIALAVPRTEAEGPGVRYALWLQGCPFRCPGCCNPEMLPLRGGRSVPVAKIVADATAAGVEGVTLLGGEPFAQAEALAEVALRVRQNGLSVMIFSGFTLEELRGVDAPTGAERLLSQTDLLVDGRYERERRTTERRWIGSDNQRMHFLTNRYSPDDPTFSQPNHLEIRLTTDGEILLNGWPVDGASTRIGPRRKE